MLQGKPAEEGAYFALGRHRHFGPGNQDHHHGVRLVGHRVGRARPYPEPHHPREGHRRDRSVSLEEQVHQLANVHLHYARARRRRRGAHHDPALQVADLPVGFYPLADHVSRKVLRSPPFVLVTASGCAIPCSACLPGGRVRADVSQAASWIRGSYEHNNEK